MFKSAAKSILVGMLISVAMSALISLLFYRLPYGPNAYIPETIISRTSATLLDLGIALAGGCAAVYAMAHPRLEGTIPGVAIATALMPPLCTIGFGIAFMDGGIILGAVLQFMTNLTAILFAGMATFIILGFNPLRGSRTRGRFQKGHRVLCGRGRCVSPAGVFHLEHRAGRARF